MFFASLSRRIAAAILLVVMTFVTSIGVFSYLDMRAVIQHNMDDAVDLHGENASIQISGTINGLFESLTGLSNNTLVGNALVDDLGRNVYLANFLNGFRLVNGVPVQVILTNFQGKMIAGNLAGTDLRIKSEQIAQYVDSNQTTAMLFRQDDTDVIAFIKPVLFANTGLAEGALIYQVALKDILDPRGNLENLDNALVGGFELAVEDRVLGVQASVKTTATQNQNADMYHSYPLQLPFESKNFNISIHVFENANAFQTLLQRTFSRHLAIGLAAMFLALVLSLLISRLLTSRLMELESKAVAITLSGNAAERLPERGGDEIASVAKAFNATLERLDVAYQNLEKQAEQKLHKLRQAIEVSSAVIIMTDAEGVIDYVNPAFTQVTGYSETEVIGQNVSLLDGELEETDESLRMWEILRNGEPWLGEFFNKRKDGTRYWSAASISPILEEDGHISGYISVQEDITNRKLAEKALQEARNEAELANRAKSEFLANMSHELRTPLNSIIGFSEMMYYEIKGPLSEDYHEYAKLITTSGRLLLETVNLILDLSKIEAGKLELECENVNMGKVVDDVIATVDVLVKAKNIEVKNQTKNMHTLFVDELRMKQLFLNIIGNAIKFTDNGSITIFNHCDDTGHKISIADTGIGMTEEQMVLAVKPFQQIHGHAYARRYQGTGLGLSLSQRIMELHGGKMHLDSQPGVGTTVTLWFPAELGPDNLNG
jgi:PAS domain S-box-containing protein